MSTIEIPTDDSVKMVRAIRQRHYEETRYMTADEKTKHDRQKVEECLRELQEFRLAKAKSQVPSA
jgi:hypothetical protein